MMINLESSRPPTLVDVQSGTLCAGGGALQLRGQDLRDGKLTLPLILACQHDPGLRLRLLQLLADGPPQSSMLDTAVKTLPFKVFDRTFIAVAAYTPMKYIVPAILDLVAAATGPPARVATPAPAHASACPRPARRSYSPSRPPTLSVSNSSAMSAPDISVEATDQNRNDASRMPKFVV